MINVSNLIKQSAEFWVLGIIYEERTSFSAPGKKSKSHTSTKFATKATFFNSELSSSIKVIKAGLFAKSEMIALMLGENKNSSKYRTLRAACSVYRSDFKKAKNKAEQAQLDYIFKELKI